MRYSEDWAEASYTYYQWQTFEPGLSCAGCDPRADEVVGVNRAYQQLLASAAGASMDAETMLIYSMMPSVLFQVRLSIEGAVRPIVEAQQAGLGVTDAAAVEAAVAAGVAGQWASCAVLQPLVGSGVASPFLADLSPLFPAPPELCAYIPGMLQPALGFTVSPAQFGLFGVEVDGAAAETFLALAVGGTSAAAMDPAAAAFVSLFLTAPRSVVLATLSANAATAAAASALAGITELQWSLLQGYIVDLVPVWGALVYKGFLASLGGAGLVITKTVETWINGEVAVFECRIVEGGNSFYVKHVEEEYVHGFKVKCPENPRRSPPSCQIRLCGSNSAYGGHADQPHGLRLDAVHVHPAAGHRL